MPERELIGYIRSLAAEQELPWLEVGVGDDAAAVSLPGGGRVLFTTDMLIEGVHFLPDTGWDLIGYKAVARTLSDLAAMAAFPCCMLAAVDFGNRRNDAECRHIVRALWRAAMEFHCPLVGGDVAASGRGLSITLTAVGLPGPAGVITRAGGRPGDSVCVTGELGGSLLGRHLTFSPRIEEALQLVREVEVHAMIDVSDGLSTDLMHLTGATGCGVVVEADCIPVSPDARAQAEQSGKPALWHALNDGEDYELIFSAGPEDAQALARKGLGEARVSVIGTLTEGPEAVLVMPDGSRRELRSEGWEHLR